MISLAWSMISSPDTGRETWYSPVVSSKEKAGIVAVLLIRTEKTQPEAPGRSLSEALLALKPEQVLKAWKDRRGGRRHQIKKKDVGLLNIKFSYPAERTVRLGALRIIADFMSQSSPTRPRTSGERSWTLSGHGRMPLVF